MPRFFSLLPTAIAAVLATHSAFADTLVLANGDRLTGDVVREHEGVIVFRSALLGELNVDATHATITRDAPAAVAAQTDAPRVIDRESVTVPVRATRDADAWKRQIELGLSGQDGLHDQTDLSVRVEAARTTTDGSTSLLLSHRYGKSDGVVTADATSANALLTRNLSEDFFVRGATRYERDPVAGLAHDAEQSVGLGYTVVERRALQLSVGAGAALRHRETERTAANWDGLVDAFGRVKVAFNDRLSLAQDFSVSAAPAARDDYKVKSQTALVNKLTEVLQMSVRYEIEYDGGATAAISARQRLVTAIGCVF